MLQTCGFLRSGIVICLSRVILIFDGWPENIGHFFYTVQRLVLHVISIYNEIYRKGKSLRKYIRYVKYQIYGISIAKAHGLGGGGGGGGGKSNVVFNEIINDITIIPHHASLVVAFRKNIIFWNLLNID